MKGGVFEEDVLGVRESAAEVVLPDRRGPVMTITGKRRSAELEQGNDLAGNYA